MIYPGEMAVLSRKPGPVKGYWNFLKPYTTLVWAFVMASLAVFAMLLTIFDNPDRKDIAYMSLSCFQMFCSQGIIKT